MAMSIIDGRFLVERPEATLLAGRAARVPAIIGANDRDLPIGVAASKDALFAVFGPRAPRAWQGPGAGSQFALGGSRPGW
jgi:para-nitrobenzyl esterase